jgi:HEPN domain-containing protein
MSAGRPERHPTEIGRSYFSDALADLEEVRRVRDSLRQWDRGCFRAQQAAAKAFRAVRAVLLDDVRSPLLSVAEEAEALRDRAPEIASRHADAAVLDRHRLHTGLPLGSPQIRTAAEFEEAADLAQALVELARRRLEAAGIAAKR